MQLNNWNNTSDWNIQGDDYRVLSNQNESVLFSVNKIESNNWELKLDNTSDLYISTKDQVLSIQLLSENPTRIDMKGTDTKNII